MMPRTHRMAPAIAIATLVAAAALLQTPPVGAVGAGAHASAALVWRTLPSMHTARYAAGAEQVFNRIIVIGGFDAQGKALNSVESYDLDYNRWTASAPMPTARGDFGFDWHGLSTGIDVFGGANSKGQPLSVVEKYNPETNHWYHLTTMPQPRRGLAVAHELSGGNMLIAGGIGPGGKVSNGVLEFIAAKHTWRTLPPMHTARYDFALITVEPSNRIWPLIYAAGGFGADHKPLRSVEAYDTRTRRWTVMAPMPAARGAPVVLAAYPSGTGSPGLVRVASTGFTVVGGVDAGGHATGTVQHYNVATNTWSTLTPVPVARSGFALVDTSGSAQPGLFALGGKGVSGGTLASMSALEAPLPAGWTLGTPLPVKLYNLRAVLATDGAIYAIARDGSKTVVALNPATHTWSIRAPLPWDDWGAAVAAGADGSIYALNGQISGSQLFQRYDPATNTWSARAPMPLNRDNAAAITGKDGKIYVMGGSIPDPSESDNALYRRGLEVYDPKTNTWQSKAPMPTARETLGATVGPDGLIYAIGGVTSHYKQDTCFATVEAYNPKTNTWSKKPSLVHPLCNVTAVTAPDGTIYAITSAVYRYSGEIEALAPGADSWHVATHIPRERALSGITLGPGGDLFVIGGADANVDATATVQRFALP